VFVEAQFDVIERARRGRLQLELTSNVLVTIER
jgi:hypothetical protein